MTVQQTLADAMLLLSGPSPGPDAELLLASALAQSRSWLYAHSTDELDPRQQAAFADLVERRRRGEPVAHILGNAGFWSLSLAVNQHTLVPRPETELLVELALHRLRSGRRPRVLDLGTGSGAIALAVAHERPDALVTASDADPRTLSVAQANARSLGLHQVRFALGDWFAAVPSERFDLVLSNPPYLAEDDPHLLQGDLRFEPPAALSSGPDGLNAIRAIARGAGAHLSAHGSLFVEHGWTQGAAVREIFREAGLADVQTHQDLERRDRVTGARRAS